MTGQKVTASTLVNRIVYQSDRTSLKKVRNEMKALQNLASKQAVATARNQIQAARDQAKEQVAIARKAIKVQQAEYAKATKNGKGVIGTSGMYDAAAVARQNKAMAKQQQADQRVLSAKMKQDEKRRRDNTNREINAQGLLVKNGFNLSRISGLDVTQKYQAIKSAQAVTQAYREQRIELSEAKEQLRQFNAIQKSIARNSRQKSKRADEPVRTGSSNWLAGAALTGVIGGGAFIAGRAAGYARETLAGSLDRNSGRNQLNNQRVGTLEADALIASVQKSTGRVMTYEQLADQAKDYNEKAGEASLGKWSQAKDGSWSIGSAGEFGDLINAVTKRGGKSAGMQVQSNLQKMNYTEYLQYLRQLQNQFKFTDQQMTFFSEAVNDGSLALGGLSRDGSNVTDVMAEIARNGGSLTQAQSENLAYLSQLGVSAKSASENLGDSFSAAFAGRMKELGINSDAVRQSFADLKPVTTELGREIGSLAAWISKHIGMIPGTASYNSKTYQEAYQSALDHKNDNAATQWAYKRWNSTSTAGEAGWNDAMSGKPMDNQFVPGNVTSNQTSPIVQAALADRNGAFYGSNPFLLAMPPINQNLQTQVTVNVDDIALKNAFTTLADTRIDDAFGAQTWDINQSLMKF